MLMPDLPRGRLALAVLACLIGIVVSWLTASPLGDRVMDYARSNCEPYLFNHGMQSWLFAERIAQL